MEDIFNKMAELTAPYKYTVDTDSKGRLYFNELPEDVYICEGSQNWGDKGMACLFIFDTGGSSLIPFKDIHGNVVYVK